MQDLLDKILKGVEDDEAKIFYLKMKGDYFRYLAEVFKDKGTLFYWSLHLYDISF